MYNFFVQPSQIQGKTIVITGSDVNHIKNVLRMKAGDELSVSNGVDGREYRCGIETISDGSVVCSLRFIKEEGLELPSKIWLFQGLPKGDKMELIIQKTVELGVYAIVPVASERTVVKLDEKKAARKGERWQAVAEAAAKQSRRRVIPKVEKVMTMEEALAHAGELDVKLIPYELAEGMGRTREILGGLLPGQSIGVFIGPEGGFSQEEIGKAERAGFAPITMGRRILRTETAGLTVMAWLMYRLEE